MEGQFEDIGLRIRMNLIKCERYKTFQEDPLNKKYPAKEKKNYQSIHRLKVLYDDDNNLSKASQTKGPLMTEEDIVEIETEAAKSVFSSTLPSESYEEKGSELEELEEEMAEEIAEEVKPPELEYTETIKARTGVFRDDKRRIDIVLVVEDDVSADTDNLKLDFLINMLRIGLQIEIEPGMMVINRKNMFVKVHAPDSILKEYGNLFAVKRYFVNNHLASNNIYCNIHEAEWIKMIRNNYTAPGYSNYERSLIVYKILRHLPFGDHVNQYGLHRLLERNIILDAYALHDGPYFYISNTTTKGTHGRQILYYNWVGLENLFQSQPLHVIHEYFGPTIAFYYGFYGFYNAFLMIASFAGIVTVIIPYLASKEPQEMIKMLCKSDSSKDHDKFVGKMCPECRSDRCVARPFEDYCIPINLNVHLDHPYVIYFSFFMILSTFIFISFWRRKEYVLNWMWEVGGRDSYFKTSKRPEFKYDYYNPRTKAKTGLTYDESELYKVVRILMSILFIPLCIIASLAVMTDSRDIYDNFADLLVSKTSTKMHEYLVLAIFGTVYTIIISLFEVALHFICYYIVKLENHKSYKEYENALISKQFGCSIVLIYSFMCWFAWLVGNLNTHYGKYQMDDFSPLSGLFFKVQKWTKTPWLVRPHTYIYSYVPEGFRYCWPFTCINEVSILLIIMIIVKQVIFRIVFNTYRLTTDYNQARKMNIYIPCWEREYMLNEFNEKHLTRMYMVLALQFSLITMFVIAFPLAPVVVLVVNIWDMRHSARKLLLASRRPLLIRNPGIGVWNNILLFIAYAAIFTNVLTLVLTTRQTLREYFQKPLNSSVFEFLLFGHILKAPAQFYIECDAPYLLSPQETNDYLFYWPGVFHFKRSHGLWVQTRRDFYFFNLILFKTVFVYVLSLLCSAFILQYIFKPFLREVEECKIVERKIKNLYSHYDRKKY